jgi:hypothetical protein
MWKLAVSWKRTASRKAPHRGWRPWEGVDCLVFRVVRFLAPRVLDLRAWSSAALLAGLLISGVVASMFFTLDGEVGKESLRRVAHDNEEAATELRKANLLIGDGSTLRLNLPVSLSVLPRADSCANQAAQTQLVRNAVELMRTKSGGLPVPRSIEVYARVAYQVLLSSLQSAPAKGYLPLEECLTHSGEPEYRLMLLTSLVFVATLVAFGILVSIIFRKVTRA